eukprot:TRINITY_DN2476_c0_g1_i1.p2 TRINITY_DN2476_c0_g1~~TRINITY_DN2476_c0_g1_i1.p2  ORF type:complete len:489 (-),score=56.62 TRINITY_DN2476_c0_g1_i1:4618-6084(-)
MMQGFLKFITSSDPAAVELRGKVIIKVIPMMNIEGVIVGNYRGCLSGQDLNRKFAAPDSRLHPTICAIKKLLQAQRGEVFGYIDLHGHSKKKCVFIYGPYYPLHMDRYVRVRILAKLLSERTQMFRYPACKFRQEPSKMNAARLVISREFDVMNSLTLEASFYGFLNAERKTIEFCSEFYERMGQHLGYAVLEYIHLLEEEKVLRLRRLFENKRRKKIIARNKGKHYKVKEVEISRKGWEGFRKESKKMEDQVEAGEGNNRPRMIINETDDEDVVQNPNEPGDRKIIRLEDCYQHPELYTDVPERKVHKMRDICKIIKEDIKREEIEDYGSDSSSSSSECEMLTGEEEANVIGNILSAIQGFPQENSGTEKSLSPPKEQEKGGSKVFLSPQQEKLKDSPHHLRGKSQKYSRPKQIELPRSTAKSNYTCFHPRQIHITTKGDLKEREYTMKSTEYNFPSSSHNKTIEIQYCCQCNGRERITRRNSQNSI